MDPHFLAALMRIAINRKVYETTVSEVKDRYYRKFRGSQDGQAASPRLLCGASTSV